MKPTKTTSACRWLRAILAFLGLVALLHPAALGADLRSAVFRDWLLQDAGGDAQNCFTDTAGAAGETKAVETVLKELGPDGQVLGAELARLTAGNVSGNDPRWRDLYTKACEARRAKRLAPLLAKWQRIIFAKHFNMGGSHYAYTEAQSDAQAERNYRPGGALCVLEQDGLWGTIRTLIEDTQGVIRNPDVSYDGKRILFAWKKSNREDDYHLYEMDAATGTIRQLTDGLGFADYEGCYLPNGDILFNSTRCVQTVDCFWTEVSNLYTCDKDGRFLRRLSFDQVHTNFPTVLPDGRVIYTRWDYNDRGQLFPQPLFQMNPDGTAQTEFYGNNSWFPTTIIHARGIPGTQKVVGIVTGHHSDQSGKLAVLDPARGRQENAGVQLIAPVRETNAERIDAYGQEGDQFQYPYPLSETQFLVTYAATNPKRGGSAGHGIYWMDIDGRRELLAWDLKISCNQPVPLAPRPVPHLRPRTVDYRKTTGTYYVQDVYVGPGLAGVPRGTVRRLRVVALEYRAAGIGRNGNRGPAGGALVSTPISVNNGAWDVKRVLGSVPVEEDGSAFFVVPARTPVYFQLLDAKGDVVQSMRSWSTLQPGENFSCVGCHEDKNSAPPARTTTLAARIGPRPLEPFYGPPRGFSFPKEIQPILDRHCIKCHTGEKEKPFGLQAVNKVDPGAKRAWLESYLNLTQNGTPNKIVNWLNAQSVPPILPPYFAGAAKSKLLTMLEERHNNVQLSREELEKIACWIDLLVPFCGDYTEAAAWNNTEKEKYARYQAKRERMEAEEARNIQALIVSQTAEAP